MIGIIEKKIQNKRFFGEYSEIENPNIQLFEIKYIKNQKNIVDMKLFFKNGGCIQIGKSGIHIKKSHKGLFTKYCGGKVTDACIAKAKASGDRKLVKRAVFAENARNHFQK